MASGMQSLGAALRDVTTPAGRLAAFRAVTEHVYGPCAPGKETYWRPKAYEDNKSRYLWTDAFGVCNYITLAAETGEQRYLRQADTLVTAVHDTLGRTRSGKSRLPGASEEEPTRGGLRIGKVHKEGHPDGDGQYFHYLTKWCFALNRMGEATGDEKYNRWAVQLAEAAHPHFVHGSGTASPRMWWKISVDMSRPLVGSEGNLDPFDGLVTYRLLQQTAGDEAVLGAEIADMERMVQNKYRRYASDDPLDLGEALWLSHWGLPGDDWARHVSERSLASLEVLWGWGYFRQPHAHRLAFREFGTTLGVQVNPLATRIQSWQRRVQGLHEFWAQHLLTRDSDISPVMFCASLVPGVWSKGYGGKLQQLRRSLGGTEE